MAKVLELVFLNNEGKSKTISVANPKNGLTLTEAKEAMEAFITADVFATGTDGKLASISKAQIRNTTIEELN